MKKKLYLVSVGISEFTESIRLAVPEGRAAEFERLMTSEGLSELLKIKEFERELRSSLEDTMSMFLDECLSGGCNRPVSIEDISDEMEAGLAYPEFR